MSGNLAQLETILNKELRIFSSILKLEQEKSDAIIKRNGSLMQKLSQEQEKFLNDINPVEKNRKSITDMYTENGPEVTLRDIAKIEGDPDSSVVDTGEKLKSVLDRIKNTQEINTRMINDNLNLFSRMMSELKEKVSPETGYNKNGIEKSKAVNPLLLDKKI